VKMDDVQVKVLFLISVLLSTVAVTVAVLK